MRFNNSVKGLIIGGVLGGLLAIVGFLIFSPQTNSVILFILLRVFIGSVVGMIAMPIMVRLVGHKFI